MRRYLDRTLAAGNAAFDWIAARCTKLPRHTLAWSAIGLALVMLLSVNLISSHVFRNVKADLTQQRLFTISDGTRTILRAIDEAISRKPKGHDFVIDRRTKQPAVGRHMSVTGG